MKMTPLFSSVRSEHVIRHSGDIDLIVLPSKRDIFHTMVTTTMMMMILMTSTMMITIININMMLIPSKGMLEDKLMAALCKFLGLVNVDRERLKTITSKMLIMPIMMMMMMMTTMMKTSRTLSSLSSSVLTSSIDSPDIGSFCVR